MIFMTKDLKEWKTMILETQEVSLRNTPAHCLDRISRPWHGEKEWKLSQPDPLTGGHEAESLVKPKWAEITDQNRGEERVEQRGKGPWRFEEEPLGIQQRNEQRPSGRNHLRPGETTRKDYRNLWLVLTQSQEFYLFSWARLEKLLGTSRMNRVVSKVLPPRQEIISPSPKAPLDAPNESWEARGQKDL